LLAASTELMEGEQGDFISPRFEQLFRATGGIVIGDQVLKLDGTGLRVRRQGLRKFEGFWGHCWQSALFPSGKAFAYNAFPPKDDGTVSFNEGFVFDGDGPLRPGRVISAPWLTRMDTAGEIVPLVIETVDGETTSIEGTTFFAARSIAGIGLLPEGYPIIQQAHATFEWNGEKAVGITERSSTPDKFQDARSEEVPIASQA